MPQSLNPTAHTNPPAGRALCQPSSRSRRAIGARAPLGLLALLLVSVGALVSWAATDSQETRSVRRVHGHADPRTTSQGVPQHWPKKSVTVTLDASLDELGPASHEAVMGALGAWISAATVPRLVFDHRPAEPVSYVRDGENRIYYAPIEIEGHERDLAVTMTFVDDATGEILESDIIVNARQPFAVLDSLPSAGSEPSSGTPESSETPEGERTSKPSGRGSGVPGDPPEGRSRDRQGGRDGADDAPGEDRDEHEAASNSDESGSSGPAGEEPRIDCGHRYDLQSVVAHEAGHFFGLGEDTSERDATMYFRTAYCETKKRDLLGTDVLSVFSLYGELSSAGKTGESPKEIAAASCAFTRPATRGSALGSLVVTLALVLGGRRVSRKGRAVSPFSSS